MTSLSKLVRSVGRVSEDPVRFWLERLDVDSRKAHAAYFNRFMVWLRRQPRWEFISPHDLLVRRLEAEDDYEVLDVVQSYVSNLKLAKATKKKAYTVVRSFFAHNRASLPDDPTFRMHGERPPVTPRLSLDNILEICHASNLCYRSAILVKWQAFLDNARLIYVGKHLGEQVVSQIQRGVEPVRLDLPGRKANENESEGRYFTFIGRDAVDALTKYFDEQRGWPKGKEPIWIVKGKRPLTKSAFEASWLNQTRRIGLLPRKEGPVGSRYGYNLHEMRDVAISLCHTRLKAQGFDMDCAKFMAGQVGQVDPLKYDKFYEDSSYMREQYLIAENCLNIISQKPTASPEEQKKIQALEERVKSLTETVESVTEYIKAQKAVL